MLDRSSSLAKGAHRGPKAEVRRPKEGRNPKSETGPDRHHADLPACELRHNYPRGADLRSASGGILRMPIVPDRRSQRLRTPQARGLPHELCTAVQLLLAKRHPHHALLEKSAAHLRLVASSAFGFRPSFGLRASGFGFDPAIGSASTTTSKETPRHGP